MIINILVLLLNLFIIFLQIRNLVTYHDEANGANTKRILMFMAAVLMTGHITYFISSKPMWFLLAVSLIGVQLYEGYGFLYELIKKKFKRE